MGRYRRAVAVVLLIVFGMSMGDWPYVDEILEKLPQPDASALADIRSTVSPDIHSKETGIDTQLAFEILLGLQAVTRSQSVFIAANIETRFDPVVVPVPFRFQIALYRPPAAALPV